MDKWLPKSTYFVSKTVDRTLGLLVILRAYTCLQETSNFDSYRYSFAIAALRVHGFIKNGSS